MTRIVAGRDPADRAGQIADVVAAMRRGRVAVVPDEGLYSLACDAFSSGGVRRIREAKGRSATALSVLVGYHRTVDGIATRIPQYARDLMTALWPGPLTLILRQQPSLAWPLQAAGVGIRMPLHPVLLAVVRDVGPTAATSANPAGYPASGELSTVLDLLDEGPDVAFDAGQLPPAQRSTVVDATGDRAVIRRHGAFPLERIEAVCPVVDGTTEGTTDGPTDGPADAPAGGTGAIG